MIEKPLTPRQKKEVKAVVRRLGRLKKEKAGGNPMGVLALGTAMQMLQKMLPRRDRMRDLE